MVGTKQSNISRLENGNYNPTLEFLNKIAKAIGKEIVYMKITGRAGGLRNALKGSILLQIFFFLQNALIGTLLLFP
ncbi:MAG: helix-turn-helix transcriptional regulator [Treponema sp.]|nr:helix-turn-helix transcriptional regulator [Treponema sp.]